MGSNPTGATINIFWCKMSDKFKERARSFLISISSDESWIDASSGYSHNELAELLQKVYDEGRKDAEEHQKWLDAHKALGVWPGAYDE